MSPLALSLLALSCASMLCARCAKVPNMPNPCTQLDIGTKTQQLDEHTLEVEQELVVDLNKHLIDIPDYCVGLARSVVGVTYTLKHQVVIVCHLPRVSLYALGKGIYSPVAVYCNGNSCQNETVKVLQYCEGEII